MFTAVPNANGRGPLSEWCNSRHLCPSCILCTKESAEGGIMRNGRLITRKRVYLLEQGRVVQLEETADWISCDWTRANGIRVGLIWLEFWRDIYGFWLSVHVSFGDVFLRENCLYFLSKNYQWRPYWEGDIWCETWRKEVRVACVQRQPGRRVPGFFEMQTGIWLEQRE